MNRKSYCGSEVNIEENFLSLPPSLDKLESKMTKNGICPSLRKTFCGYFFKSLRKEPKQCEYIHMYGATLLKFNSFLC